MTAARSRESEMAWHGVSRAQRHGAYVAASKAGENDIGISGKGGVISIKRQSASHQLARRVASISGINASKA